jgi:hypothetical protein
LPFSPRSVFFDVAPLSFLNPGQELDHFKSIS